MAKIKFQVAKSNSKHSTSKWQEPNTVRPANKGAPFSILLLYIAKRVRSLEREVSKLKDVRAEDRASLIPGPDHLLSLKEFLLRYRVARSSFYDMRKAGTGPKETRIKTRIYIRLVDAEEWLAKMNGPVPLNGSSKP